MSTRNIVPRADGEGGIGISIKKWATGFINALTVITINGVAPYSFNWTVITGATPAVKNNGYICDTSSAGFTLTLPAAPSIGDCIAWKDAAGTFSTKNLTIGRNGLKIMGLSEDMVISQDNVGGELVYSGATNGWRL